MTPRDTFKAAHRKARLGRMTLSESGLVFRRWRRSSNEIAAQREETEPRGFYWAVATQQDASTSDRRFYVQRARQIRRAGYKTIHPT